MTGHGFLPSLRVALLLPEAQMLTLSCPGAIVAAGLLVLLLGCSDNPTPPSTVETPDVASLLTEMSPRGRIDGTSWVVPSGLPGFMVAPTIDPARCTYSPISDFFVCPDAVAANRMIFKRMYRLIDAAGDSQSKPDANTSAIETRTTVVGTDSTLGAVVAGVWSTRHVAGQSDMILSGIRSDAQTLNGIATTALDINNYGDPARELRGIITETATNLVLPNPKAGRIWPSGTFKIVRSPGLDIGNTTLIETTFDGNGHMTVTTTTDSGTTTCRVTMAGPPSPGDGCTSSTP